MANEVYLTISQLPRPVLLSGCDDLTEYFPALFPGWEFTRADSSKGEPLISLRRANGKYRLSAAWLEESQTYSDKVDALCGLVARLIRATVNHNPEALCLHAAAVEMNGRLLVFPDKYRAGKSFLSVCLAAAGHKLVSDDVLPVDLRDYHGVAPGIAPRLRLPLPENTGDESRRYIDENMIIEGSRYAYVDPAPDRLYMRGTHVPPGAFVLLDRREGAEAQIEPVGTADVLRQVIWQNFAREVDASRILGALCDIVTQAGRYRLRFDRAEDAIRLLEDRFSNWEQAQIEPGLSSISPAHGASGPRAGNGNRFVQKENVQKITVENEHFLTSPDGNSIHHLNPIGSAIWGLLEKPVRVEEIFSLLKSAFPEVDSNLIEKDIRKLVDSLKTRKLVEAV